MADDISDGVGGITLHLRCGVGVGAESEACIVVAQRTGQRLDVHAVRDTFAEVLYKAPAAVYLPCKNARFAL